MPALEQPDYKLAAKELNQFASRHGLTISTIFIPWSKSRNAREKHPSFHWLVTILHNGKPVLTTDYMMGCAHAPSYKQGRNDVDHWAAVRRECESGRRWNGKPIEPPLVYILSSLAMDSGVLDHAIFESWGADLGYGPDSRKGEAIYRKCLEHALALRSALGDAELNVMREIAARM